MIINQINQPDLSELRLPALPLHEVGTLSATSLEAEPALLRAKLITDGYLYFKGLLDANYVEGIADQIEDLLVRGHLDLGSSPERHVRFLPSTPSENAFLSQAHCCQDFIDLPYQPPIERIAADILGSDPYLLPRKWLRVVYPEAFVSDSATTGHQDFVGLRGTPDVLTCWVPLRNADRLHGALRIARGSQLLGPLPETEDSEGRRCTANSRLIGSLPWETSNFEPGDVLIFHGYTIHDAPPNGGSAIRLSVDFRFQRVDDPYYETAFTANYRRSESIDLKDPGSWSWDPRAALPNKAEIIPMDTPVGALADLSKLFN